jgi:prevent-host-death family protein
MSLVTLEEAVLNLPELVRASAHGEEIVLTQNSLPVARIVSISPDRPRPVRGSGKGFIRSIAADFDATSEGFEDVVTPACR